MPKAAQNPQADPDLHKLTELAPLLRQRFLEWWQAHGRRSIEQMPWMFTPDGCWPDSGEQLCCLGTWVADLSLQWFSPSANRSRSRPCSPGSLV